MKNGRVIALVCTILNIILIIICGIFYFRTDRAEPEFKFIPSELIYTNTTENAGLMENITAADSRDGDVTDRIVIEKIVENRKESSIIVFYAVSDKAGNVAKISRVFPAEFAQNEAGGTTENSGAAETPEEVPQEPAVNTENMPAEGSAAENGNQESNDTADGEDVDLDETEAEDGEAAESENNETTADEEEETAEPGTEESTYRENVNAAAQTADSNERVRKEELPVIALKTSEVTTNAGTAPAWVEVIGALTDDKDSYETLFYNLSVSKYDVNKSGTYKVTLATKDSDGNLSEPAALTIHVK